MSIELPASYDNWRTYCPSQDAEDAEVQCMFCDHTSYAQQDGEDCEDCGETDAMRVVEPSEPDWDSMPGGHDDY
jgi:hypothetical protein